MVIAHTFPIANLQSPFYHHATTVTRQLGSLQFNGILIPGNEDRQWPGAPA